MAATMREKNHGQEVSYTATMGELKIVETTDQLDGANFGLNLGPRTEGAPPVRSRRPSTRRTGDGERTR